MATHSRLASAMAAPMTTEATNPCESRARRRSVGKDGEGEVPSREKGGREHFLLFFPLHHGLSVTVNGLWEGTSPT
jgi:hypothetical protein